MEPVRVNSSLACGRQGRSPSLQLLKTFLLVALRGSVKAAAEDMCVTPTAVSQQIKLLERQLGLALFHRKPNSLELTEAGSHYLDSINALFSRIDLATEQVRRRYRRALVRLQVPSLFFNELVMPCLSELTSEQSGIDLQIFTSASSLSEHPVDVDVSIIVGNGGWKNLHAVNLLPQTFVAAGQPGLLIRGNVRTVADIAHQALLAYRNRPKLWDQWAALCGLGELRAKQIIRFDSLSAVVHAAERGVGIALVSAPLTAKRFADVTLRQIGPSLTTGESYFVITRNEDATRPEVEAVVGWLLRRFGRSEAVATESRPGPRDITWTAEGNSRLT